MFLPTNIWRFLLSIIFFNHKLSNFIYFLPSSKLQIYLFPWSRFSQTYISRLAVISFVKLRPINHVLYLYLIQIYTKYIVFCSFTEIVGCNKSTLWLNNLLTHIQSLNNPRPVIMYRYYHLCLWNVRYPVQNVMQIYLIKRCILYLI
jgi:hypothetical protein